MKMPRGIIAFVMLLSAVLLLSACDAEIVEENYAEEEAGQTQMPWAREDLTEEDVRRSLMENSEALKADIEQFLGVAVTFYDDIEMFFLPQRGLLIEVDASRASQRWPFTALVYLKAWPGSTAADIRWAVQAIDYGTLFVVTPFTPRGVHQPFDGLETINIRLYDLIWQEDGDELTYVTEEICAENWAQEAAVLIRQSSGLDIRDIWYEGNRLFADLTPATALMFGYSGHAAIHYSAVLLASLASLPYVEEIEILVGGTRGIFIDGFGYPVHIVSEEMPWRWEWREF